MATVTYTGDFGTNSAGSDGLSTTLTGEALPSNARISSITYSINMSADGYSSSKSWVLHHFYLSGGSPSASYKSVAMSGTKGTVSGNMSFSQSDVSVFDGSVTLYAKVNTTHSSTSYMKAVTVTVTYTIGYNTSSISLSDYSVNAGSSIRLTLSNSEISSVYHKVKWSCGSKTTTTTLSTGTTSSSYTVPQDWCEEIPNATSAKASVTVETLSSGGTSYGSQSAAFTINVPSNIVPTIGGVTASKVNNEVPESWDSYIQNKSGVTLAATGVSSQYGASISSYTFTGTVSGIEVFSSTQNTSSVTITPITSSGMIKYSVYVTDSRGRKSSSVSVSIDVLEYTPPIIQSALAYRCLSTGETNEEGTYIGAQMNYSYHSMSGQNTVTTKCEYQKNGDSTWIVGLENVANDTSYVVGNNDVDTQHTYQVRFTVQDAFSTITKTVGVSTSVCTMFFRNGGTGIGIGKVSEHNFAVEFNPEWLIYYGKYNLRPVVYSSSQPTDGYEGLIWLCPKE